MSNGGPGVGVGQIVQFRHRLWRVNGLSGREFLAVPIDGGTATPKRFLLDLEKPQPASIPVPDFSLLGSGLHQDLLLRAYRLSMIHGTAPFLSLQRSSVVPMNYP